jgi:hypothetical protein
LRETRTLDGHAAMMHKASGTAGALSWRPLVERIGNAGIYRRGHPQQLHRHRARRLVPRALIGVALLLAGGVAGLAAGQSMASRAAHRTGACIALNMATALGYLDAEQRRRVRHALSTALNPEVDLFSGGRPSLKEACAPTAGS